MEWKSRFGEQVGDEGSEMGSLSSRGVSSPSVLVFTLNVKEN